MCWGTFSAIREADRRRSQDDDKGACATGRTGVRAVFNSVPAGDSGPRCETVPTSWPNTGRRQTLQWAACLVISRASGWAAGDGRGRSTQYPTAAVATTASKPVAFFTVVFIGRLQGNGAGCPRGPSAAEHRLAGNGEPDRLDKTYSRFATGSVALRNRLHQGRTRVASMLFFGADDPILTNSEDKSQFLSFDK